MAQLILDKIAKRYGDGGDGLLAVDDLDVEIADGEFMVFVGPSGCGKSTALRMIAGLETITSGELRIDGDRVNELDPAQRDIAMVFQNYALYPHMSVYRNIAYPLRVQGVTKATIDERVRATAATLRLTDLLARRPGQLSGGQLQRVAMGRALVRQPRAFLMDEPLSNLDAKLRLQMRSEITAIQRELNVTTIYVTHDQVEAMTMGDRVAVLRFGVLQQVATPSELFWNPANAFVAAFVGSPPMNLFEAGLEYGGEGATVHIGPWAIGVGPDAMRTTGLAGAGSDRTILGVRPEHVDIVATDDPAACFRGEVRAVEHLGTEIICHVDIDVARLDAAPDARPGVIQAADGPEPGPDDEDRTLVCRARTKFAPSVGERLALSVDVNELRFFDAETRLAI